MAVEGTELHRLRADLRALHDITVSLAAGGPPGTLLAEIATHLSSRVRFAAVLLHADGAPFVAGDAPDDVTAHPAVREALRTGCAVTHEGALAVPMRFDGRSIGALFLRPRDGAGLDAHDAAFYGTVANVAATSLRDAEARALEAELRRTKGFLERLIDATVDGIVAADLRGRVLLFNKGAERVTGYAAAEVVERLSVAELYQPGQAVVMMRRLRESQQSGEGRLGPIRLDAVTRTGELVPIELSLALVGEPGREIATVGVLRDLREQLRVERELQMAQERLAVVEKAAVLSELAGAAAHELNQPLTSVLGYSELLFRRTRENEKGREELAAILREAERMAQIVKKIGTITRYETTPYVGTKRIVDLDRASIPPPKG